MGSIPEASPDAGCTSQVGALASVRERSMRRSPPSTSCEDLFRACEPCQGASPPEAARFQRALDKAEGSENKTRQEVDGSACRQVNLGRVADAG